MSGRRRYVAIGNKWVEVDIDYRQDFPDRQDLLWNDRAYQDMNDPRFASRSQHREYMERNGLTTADDFTNEWKDAAKKRAAFYQGVDPTRGRDIAEAVQKVNQGYKPRRHEQES
ncbi:MAG: hypothetical protein MUO77_04645 [Anaerolineales bacterium]|nr:hypothetical protein [Anaerolineales bacterium]